MLPSAIAATFTAVERPVPNDAILAALAREITLRGSVDAALDALPTSFARTDADDSLFLALVEYRCALQEVEQPERWAQRLILEAQRLDIAASETRIRADVAAKRAVEHEGRGWHDTAAEYLRQAEVDRRASVRAEAAAAERREKAAGIRAGAKAPAKASA